MRNNGEGGGRKYLCGALNFTHLPSSFHCFENKYVKLAAKMNPCEKLNFQKYLYHENAYTVALIIIIKTRENFTIFSKFVFL